MVKPQCMVGLNQLDLEQAAAFHQPSLWGQLLSTAVAKPT